MNNIKTYRVLVAVLAVLVLLLGLLLVSKKGQPEAEPQKDQGQTNVVANWRTNTVDRWQTNVVANWRTNTVELWRTNTVVQNFTNEVIKEVPAKLSAAAKEAATAGYMYLSAPSLAGSSDALYKAGPIAVEVVVNAHDKSVVADDAGVVTKGVEAVLKSKNIPVAQDGPQRLTLTITPIWKSDLPMVAILAFRLDLREKGALQRQGDIIRSDTIVWSTVGSKFIRMLDPAEELKTAMQEQLDKFCDAYLKAKDAEKNIKSRIPAMPADFLSGA